MNQARVRNGGAGFSMLEMLLVVTIILILSAFAIISINGTLPASQATAGLNAAEQVFHQGRNLAITERRNYTLVPIAPNQLQLVRNGVGNEPLTTALPVVTLPVPAQFMLDPSITTNTPDQNGVTMCSSGLCFGNGTITQTWLSDGTFIDSFGKPLNATIFVGVPNNPGAQRAFTVLGTTGRIRAYKWTGNSWVLQ